MSFFIAVIVASIPSISGNPISIKTILGFILLALPIPATPLFALPISSILFDFSIIKDSPILVS